MRENNVAEGKIVFTNQNGVYSTSFSEHYSFQNVDSYSLYYYLNFWLDYLVLFHSLFLLHLIILLYFHESTIIILI